MKIIFEELERQAYINGDVEKARLYGLILDHIAEIEDLEADLYD